MGTLIPCRREIRFIHPEEDSVAFIKDKPAYTPCIREACVSPYGNMCSVVCSRRSWKKPRCPSLGEQISTFDESIWLYFMPQWEAKFNNMERSWKCSIEWKNKTGSLAQNYLCGLKSHLYCMSFKNTLISKDIQWTQLELVPWYGKDCVCNEQWEGK